MDESQNQSETTPSERTPEEMAWDQEFENDTRTDVGADLRGLLNFAARIPGALIQVPMALVPDETTRHARAAVRESFLAFRSLLGAIGDGIEHMLAEPGTTSASSATVQGPPGTWGTGRAAMTTSSARVKRIEVSEEEENEGREPSAEPGDMP